MLFEVATDEGKVSGGENHGGEPREQDRDSVQPFYTHAGSRVGSVGFCKTCVEQSKDGASVGRESCKDVGSVAVDAPDNTDMFSRLGEVDGDTIDSDGRDNLGILNK